MIRLNIFKRIVLGVLAVAMGVMASPVSEHGQLSISGFDVVDKNKQPYVLRGMSFFWKIWSNNFYNANVVSTLASTGSTGWGANVIRAAISDFDVATAKNMIDYANASGIYIIIDNHSHCAHKDPNNAKNFFSQVAQYVRQKNYVHVMYEVFNEPVKEDNCSVTDGRVGNGNISWTSIKTYAESVIGAIRQYDPNGIVFVGTPNFSAATEVARSNPITMYSNIAYVLHFYASTSAHGAYRNSLLRAKCNDFPVFVTEWGTSEASGNGAMNKSMNDTWMSFVESIGVGWANWSIYDKNETSSALVPGAGGNGNWSDGQLSASGKYVRNIMKGRNAGKSLSEVGLSPTTIDCKILEGGSSYQFVRTGIVEFGYGFQAEDYLDSANARTVEVKDALNGMVMQTMSSSQESALVYAFENAPTDVGYYRFQVRLSTNESGYIYYSLNGGVSIDSVKYEPTGTEYEMYKGLLVLPQNNGLDMKVTWKGNVTLDNFFIGRLSQADSISFGVLEIDEQGNHNSLDPKNVLSGGGDVSSPGGFEGSEALVTQALEFNVHLDLNGRSLAITGAAASSVDVMDMQGRLLVKASVVPGATVDLAHLRAGSYVVRVKALGKVFNQRILLK